MNDRTVILHVRRYFRPDFDKLVGADQTADMHRLRAERPRLPASAIFVHWRGGSTTASMTKLVHHPFGVEAPVALVAGRHSECDLGSIPGASLRHALVLLWPPTGDAELPLAEVLDLGTQTGIALPDGRLAMRLAGSMPIRFGVASADVTIVHAAAGEPLALEPAALSKQLAEVSGQAEVTTHSNQPYTRHLDVSPEADERNVSPEADERNVSPEADERNVSPEADERNAAGADGEEERPEVGPRSCVEVPVKPGQERTFGSEHMMLTQMVRIGEANAQAKVHVRAQDLERGVRLGRYLRCRGASVLGRDDHVSRVHALVLDRGGHRWLFDTASTNGTAVVDVDTGVATGPVRGERTFALLEGQAPSLAGQVALLDVGVPEAPS